MAKHLDSRTLALLLITAFIAGCAGLQSSRDLVKDVHFERIESNIASIRNVYLHRTAKGMDLHGELTRKSTARGAIPGHLHVTLKDVQGNVLKSADVDYRRHNKQSNHSHFSISLPITLKSGSTIEIKHMALELSNLSAHPQWTDTQQD
ncbi:MAG: hypothetical protein COB33_002650 [Thiotrichaceae bacterium]|nr:hypothetical protein [Thiotrichaceae bacterium]PCI14076.1 MAG: hypothetical protein COB71_03775 [Thiotrichales bacterium]